MGVLVDANFLANSTKTQSRSSYVSKVTFRANWSHLSTSVVVEYSCVAHEKLNQISCRAHAATDNHLLFTWMCYISHQAVNVNIFAADQKLSKNWWKNSCRVRTHSCIVFHNDIELHRFAASHYAAIRNNDIACIESIIIKWKLHRNTKEIQRTILVFR